MKQTSFDIEALFVIILIGIFCGLTTQAWAIDETNNVAAACYVTSVSSDADGNCPSWATAIDRNSTDDYTNLYLKVEIDGCYYTHYDVYTVEQDSTPEPIDLEENDVFLVWDEDTTHGSTEDFSFSGKYLLITDPNTQCPYVDVSTHPSNTKINWALYLVETSGTLVINNTDLNEHDAIHFHDMRFEKYDDVADNDCRSPGDSIQYTICFESLDENAYYEDAYIIDWLDEGVDYVNADYTIVSDGNSFTLQAPDPYYYSDGHFYRWPLGDIYGTDANCVTLDVEVNYIPEPGSTLNNVAELYAIVYDSNGLNPTDTLIATATEDTLVCCWGDDPNIIFVDVSATGTNVGTSWENAYTDLADALYRATYNDCSDAVSIYVAQETYNPENTDDTSFVLPDNCSMYGGFPSGGCDFEDRDPKEYETILTGLIDEDSIPDADVVVTMGDECLLSGFIVNYGYRYNIYGEDVDFEITDCIVRDSERYGICTEDCNVSIQWCTVRSNESHGIWHEGEAFTLTVENSWLLRNGEYGIYCVDSTPSIVNSIISESDLTEQGRQGIRIVNPTSSPKLYNCTISNNNSVGVYFEDSGEPNLPDVRNCIIYYNNAPSGNQLAGFEADEAAYNCCIQDCNEVNSNHNDMPGFAYTIDLDGTPNPANYHLANNSICIDQGVSVAGIGDDDYDGEERIMGTTVDIGADEVNPDCSDVANPLDLDADGIVNLNEFAPISQVWLSHDPNDPACDPNHVDYVSDPNDSGYISETQKQNWDATYNFADTGDSQYAIDLDDLGVIVDDWLWIACWKLEELNASAEVETASLSVQSLALESVSLSAASVGTTSTESGSSEADTEAMVDTLAQVIGFLDEIIADSPDNVSDIEELRATLWDQLLAILAEE